MTLPAPLLALLPRRNAIPPQPEILERQATDYGERLLIRYSVRPGERVRAFLLLPHPSAERHPAVVASHQHNGEYHLGKSEPAGLKGNPSTFYGVELCRRGFVVLCPDHAGFEDRQQQNRDGALYPLQGKTYETFLFTAELLHGGSLTARYLFDLCQAVDLLCEWPTVDSGRIGAIGHSLGGQMTLWLAAYDSRVKAAFASCGFSRLEAIQSGGFPHNLALYLPGMLTVGDFELVVGAVAPRAFGMSHGREDTSFPIHGVEVIRRCVADRFPPGNLMSLTVPGGHDFPASVRERAYDFLEAHLPSPAAASPEVLST